MPEPTNRREGILARLAELLSGCGVPIERNRMVDITPESLPCIILRDGDEEAAPPGGAPPQRLLERWRMTPEIEAYVSLRNSPAPNAELNALYEKILAQLAGDAALSAMLAQGTGIEGARYSPAYAEGRTDIAGFSLSIDLVYDKK